LACAVEADDTLNKEMAEREIISGDGLTLDPLSAGSANCLE